MKISELIEKLQETLDKHGNLWMENSTGLIRPEMIITIAENGKPVAVAILTADDDK